MSQTKKKAPALGRGLAALIPAAPAAAPAGSPSADAGGITFTGTSILADSLRRIPVESIVPMPDQPRTVFATEELEELAESIRESGILQPILVREMEDGNFQLIAGERRWRAAQLVGLATVPALIKDVDERQAYQLALIENLQREDLNPLEVAQGFKRLIDIYGMNQNDVAEQIGKDRATVNNYLRLLTLPPPFIKALKEGNLSFGHARALAGLSAPQLSLMNADKIVSGRVSVRELERLASQLKKTDNARKTREDTRRGETPQVRMLRRQLEQHLGMKVRLIDKNGKGRVTVEYATLDELDTLLKLLGAGG